MSLSNEVYDLSGGRIVLNGAVAGQSKWGGVASQVYNWGTQGARDAENNANYDVARRMERTVAVLSCVGSTYEEKRQSNAFTSTDWNDTAHREHLSRIGYGDSAQQNAQKMINNASWQVQSGTTAGQKVTIDSLTKEQLRQLTATGTFMHNGERIVSVNGTTGMQQALQAAQKERDRNFQMFHVHNNDQARYNLQQIGAGQKKLLANIAVQYGVTFSGSQKDINALERKLCSERDRLKKLSMDTSQIETQLNDIKIAKETGLSLSNKRNDGSAAAQRRSYGRQVIRRELTGDEINQGIVFYNQLGNLTKQGVGLAYRSLVRAGTGVVGATASGVEFLAKGTTLGRGAGVVKNKSKEFNDAAIDFARKKSKGEKRARRDAGASRRTERGNLRFERGTKKLDDRIAALEQKKTNAKRGKDTFSARDQKKLDRDNRRRDRRTRRGNRREKWQNFKKGGRTFLSNARSKINNVKYTLSKFNIMRFVDFIKKKVIFIGAIAIGVPILAILGGGAIAALIPFFVSFMSIPATDLTGALDEVNYVQYIVNETASDLAAQFEEVAKNDAETHFLIDDPIPSNNGYDWYKTVSEGEIEHIWAADEMSLPEDQRQELSGVSANLLQITSLMHYRYQDDLGFEEYPTAKAYEYYMFVRTHRVAEDSAGNRTYSYEELDDHDESALYSAPPVYNPENQTLIRGEELCENIYIHGYNNITFGSDATLARAVNRARATMEGFMTSCVRNIAQANGVDFNTAGMDRRAEGIWINEVPHDNGGYCTNYTAYPAGYTDAFLYTTDEGGSCPGYEHVHGPECYEFVETGGYYEDGVTPRGYDRLICGKEEHTHSPWVSETNPGCYDTAYVCNGHCGGHICPTVNVEVDMAWEDVMQYDNFKTPYFIAETSFTSIRDWSRCRTIEAWAEKWMDRASEWFSPFPDSPITALVWCGRNLMYKGAGAIDWITSEDRNANPEEEDVYDFEGWWTDSGTIDEGLLGDIESFYGTYETNFEDGVDAWKDFEVVFPVGSGQALTDDQIAAVLEQVRQVNPGISARKLMVLEEALRGVGQYYYSLTGSAHMNAINNTSGAGECSGFVGGVLNRALGTSYGSQNAAAYYSYGTATQPTAGDVIAFVTPGGQASGHVLFYVGYLPDGVEGYKTINRNGGAQDQSGPGRFVIDCTPSCGGSVIRKYNDFNGMHAWGGY